MRSLASALGCAALAALAALLFVPPEYEIRTVWHLEVPSADASGARQQPAPPRPLWQAILAITDPSLDGADVAHAAGVPSPAPPQYRLTADESLHRLTWLARTRHPDAVRRDWQRLAASAQTVLTAWQDARDAAAAPALAALADRLLARLDALHQIEQALAASPRPEPAGDAHLADLRRLADRLGRTLDDLARLADQAQRLRSTEPQPQPVTRRQIDDAAGRDPLIIGLRAELDRRWREVLAVLTTAWRDLHTPLRHAARAAHEFAEQLVGLRADTPPWLDPDLVASLYADALALRNASLELTGRLAAHTALLDDPPARLDDGSTAHEAAIRGAQAAHDFRLTLQRLTASIRRNLDRLVTGERPDTRRIVLHNRLRRQWQQALLALAALDRALLPLDPAHNVRLQAPLGAVDRLYRRIRLQKYRIEDRLRAAAMRSARQKRAADLDCIEHARRDLLARARREHHEWLASLDALPFDRSAQRRYAAATEINTRLETERDEHLAAAHELREQINRLARTAALRPRLVIEPPTGDRRPVNRTARLAWSLSAALSAMPLGIVLATTRRRRH